MGWRLWVVGVVRSEFILSGMGLEMHAVRIAVLAPMPLIDLS
jgi:hypothetical protein